MGGPCGLEGIGAMAEKGMRGGRMGLGIGCRASTRDMDMQGEEP